MRRSAVMSVVFWLAVGLAFVAPWVDSPAADKDPKLPQVIELPESGLWVDPSAPQRFCVTQRGTFGGLGDRLFVYCSPGYNVGGSAVIELHEFLEGSMLLYRLQDDGGYLVPTPVVQVDTEILTGGTWVLRFGIGSGVYSLALQQRPSTADVPEAGWGSGG